MKNIICLKFREIENWDTDCGNFERYVIEDENFQEIEDFLSDNFKEIKISEYTIEY